jgi:hypothetical protein
MKQKKLDQIPKYNMKFLIYFNYKWWVLSCAIKSYGCTLTEYFNYFLQLMLFIEIIADYS